MYDKKEDAIEGYNRIDNIEQSITNNKKNMKLVENIKKQDFKDLSKSATDEINRLGAEIINKDVTGSVKLNLEDILSPKVLKEYSRKSKEIISENPVCKKLNFLPVYENFETSVSNILKNRQDLIKNTINNKLK